MSRTLQGLSASKGIAIGTVWIYQPPQVELEEQTDRSPEEEIARLDAAIETVRGQLTLLAEKARAEIGEKEAQIFEAHQLILEDPELVGLVKNTLEQEKINAETAVDRGVEKYAQMLLALESEYFQARSQDVRDVGRRVIYALQGIDLADFRQPDEPVIILADDLTPSDTVQFEVSKILGFCTLQGGPTSHTAILARSLNVPAVVSLAGELGDIEEGSSVILDGGRGTLTLSPSGNQVQAAQQQKSQQGAQWARQLEAASQPAVTRDGIQVEVVANIGSVADARQAVEFGAEGVGLLRTEFLYIDKKEKPSFEEQVSTYQAIAEVMGDRPVVVRTLDIGGDKQVAYLGLEDEPNPFLGWRAIRMISEKPGVLEEQFRALLLGFANADLRIMLPLVSQVEEVVQAKQIFAQAKERLAAEKGFSHPKVQFGMMVEVPSAALLVAHFASHVDFFSIGTNDLAQYTLAVDRTNARVADLASPFHPAVLRLIAGVIETAHAHSKWVGLCGEMAGDSLAAPLLLGLGLDEFSMAAASIPVVKEVLRGLSAVEAQGVAREALKMGTTGDVLDFLKSKFPE